MDSAILSNDANEETSMTEISFNSPEFSYLQNARESGISSVYGATCVVMRDFNLNFVSAKKVVLRFNELVKQGEDPSDGPSNAFKNSEV
jgi:hypothetical protein